MSDYEVGYKKPPKHTQFKKGVCANPRGRGKKKQPDIAEIVGAFATAEIPYRENGVEKVASRDELLIRKQIAKAVKGHVPSAAALLKLLEHPPTIGKPDPISLIIRGGLPENYEVGEPE